MLPTIVGTGTEEYLQENVLKPLGMSSTTYYPFSPGFKDKLMPLRFGRGAEGVEGQSSQVKYEVTGDEADAKQVLQDHSRVLHRLLLVKRPMVSSGKNLKIN